MALARLELAAPGTNTGEDGLSRGINRLMSGVEILIRPERADDRAAIATLVATAFGRPDEAHLIDRLRTDGDALTSLVATASPDLAGHILFSRLDIAADHGTIAAASLAPLAVLPAWQRGGIGSALVRAGIDACRACKVSAVIVLGHETYYPRFGFAPALARNL
ncbi:MAG: GNAT family N-acetyltransferase, partial [Alphaproteobacteria bacterium]